MPKKLENKGEIKYTRAIIYCRVSSDKQASEGHGLEAQERRCRDYAERRGYQVDRVFKDTYSGGGDYMDRPDMSELLSFLDKRPYLNYVVIFDDLKRFAREVKFHLKLREELRARNAIPECPNYSFDDSPEGVFIETVHAAHNQLEREQNKRQVIQKMKARIENGYWAFGTKRGYKIIKDPIHGKLSVLNGNDAKLLKEALEGFATGVFVRKMDACKYLVEKGFWKLEPKRYVYLFDKMLRDVFFAGYIEYPKWEVTRRKGHHDALISLETYEVNQKRLGGGEINKKIRKDVSDDFPLRGLLNCSECGKHLTAAWTKGNGGKYGFYFCQNKKCKIFRKSINRDDIDKEFKKLLLKTVLKSEIGKLVPVVFDRVWDEEVRNFYQKINQEKREESDRQEKIKSLTNMVIGAKTDILKKVYEAQLENIYTELKNTEGQENEALDVNIPYQTALEKSKDMLEKPYKVWNKVDTQEKHKLFFFIIIKKCTGMFNNNP